LFQDVVSLKEELTIKTEEKAQIMRISPPQW